MPFIGNKPSAVPLTSADITDGIITSAKIADGTIVNADISATAAIAGSKLSGAGFSGATTTTSAVDITLTSSSTQVQNVIMTAADKSVILPDATTLTTKGNPIYQITNSGPLPFYIKCNGGFNLIKLNFGSSVSLSLIDNSTSEGIWSNNPFTTFTSIGYTLFSPAATIATGTTGTPALVYQYFQNTNSVTTSKISTSSGIICYHKGTSNRDVYGVVVSYSGSTITVNSETLLYSGSTTASTSSQVVMLSATNGLLFVTRASNNVVVPFTISGTTITAGTASATFGTGTGTSNQRQLGQAIAMDSTTALVPDRNSTSAATWTLRTIIHNGASAPTVGTASTAITTYDVLSFPYLSKIDATNAFACYKVATTFYTVARVITISGSSAPTLQTANTSSTSNIGTMIYPSKVSSTEFIVIGNDSMDRYTVSGTSVTYTSNGTYTNTGQINGDNINFVFSFNNGENMYTQGRASNFRFLTGETAASFSVFKKINNFYELCNSTELEKSITLGTVFGGAISEAIDMVELDTDIILLVTNNGGSTTISAIILKYKGI